LVNNPNPDYSPWQGIWTIGTLAPGEVRTFDLEVFVLPAASSTIFLDSSATLNEQGGAASIQPKGAKLRIDNLFPNPAREEVTVTIHSEEDLETSPLQIFDAFGKLVLSQNISLEKGTTFVQLDNSIVLQ